MISLQNKLGWWFKLRLFRKTLPYLLLSGVFLACAPSSLTPDQPASPPELTARAVAPESPALWEALNTEALLNPLMPGADPHAILLDGTLWIYPTWDTWRGDRFFAFSSTNLLDWQRHGPVLDFDSVNWIGDDGQRRHYAWAPCLAQNNEAFYFYYSVGPQQETPSRIGVAIGRSPAGPFEDSGKPLLTGGNGFEAIDPMVFRDPVSGQFYFFAGGSAGAKLRVFKLNPDMISFAREIFVKTPPRFTEGAFMHYHEGTYYLSYSHGGWRDSSYSVHYATAGSPVGPWHYHGPILVSNERHKGPGHHSIVQDSATGNSYIFYHRWDDAEGHGPFDGSRQIAVEKLEYNSEGLIRPVRMSGGASQRSSVSSNAR